MGITIIQSLLFILLLQEQILKNHLKNLHLVN